MTQDSSLTNYDDENSEIPAYIAYPKSKEFSSSFLQKCPAPVVSRSFIDSINTLLGYDYYGDPVGRVVWGQDQFRYAYGEKWATYICQRRQKGQQEFYDIGIPRLIVETKTPPQSILPGWNVAIQGPKPVRGLYQYLITIQDTAGNFCYPDSRHLKMIEIKHFQRERDPVFKERFKDEKRREKLAKIHEQDAFDKEQKQLEVRKLIRDAYKADMRRITSKRPNAGRVPEKKRLAS